MEVTLNKRDEQIDQLEAIIVNEMPSVNIQLRHFFTDGLYAREMSAPEGAMITSKIHKTEHIFILSQGCLSVWDDEGQEKIIEAPYIGITKAGTRRVALVHEDIIWTTFHANPENENEYQIEERIIQKHTNPLLEKSKTLIS